MKGLVQSADGIFAFPHYWQTPAQTEKAACEALLQAGTGKAFEYVGFAWATVIDGLRGRSRSALEILITLNDIPPRAQARRLSVAQHINALDFVELYQAAGITDLLWSHATHGLSEVKGMRIHPFPLFPAQTADDVPPTEINNDKPFLANFIGAYNPGLYLTDVRKHIFGDEGTQADLCIKKREAWHFDRMVYQEQVSGVRPDASQLDQEKSHREEYLDAIRNSWFTLCPSGSGPSSIRIFESLCLGSIPIILTKTLRLPGDEGLWREAALIEEDSVTGYRTSLEAARQLTPAKRRKMLQAGRRLCGLVSPSGYANLISQVTRQ